nr:MAG TPA: tail assembly chaperone protein [Caudoviricetes sp.]
MVAAGIITSPREYWGLTRMETAALIREWNRRQKA